MKAISIKKSSMQRGGIGVPLFMTLAMLVKSLNENMRNTMLYYIYTVTL